MSKEDAAIVYKIFERTPMPNFTIVSKYEPEGHSFTQLEMCFESSAYLWDLAKQVQMEQMFDRELNDAIEKGKAIQLQQLNKLLGNE